MYNVVFLGAPGAGKGTQAALVAGRANLAHLASGDLFRKAIERDDELGRQVKTYLENGQLVPDSVTVAMVLNRISELENVAGVILDGFPRTLSQAEALSTALEAQGERVDRVVYIAVPQAELERRLSDRWVCRSCQATYSGADREASASCRKCGGELYQRPDDTPETVKSRLEVYFRETAPLIEYYRQRGVLAEINGQGDIENITARITEALKQG
ncbi:MAG: adenylate kinase [Dehalogenimonas sp.]|jgi:adenylate kinase|uniref:Adenylate kinase n=1 Tax=Candidatus Dehalogenimonas loeffleri TaxID=3127115 RepID=A0ABZ2J448_9CHLR|nr:adenylate kinase [Dehalogenimonas sp.]